MSSQVAPAIDSSAMNMNILYIEDEKDVSYLSRNLFQSETTLPKLCFWLNLNSKLPLAWLFPVPVWKQASQINPTWVRYEYVHGLGVHCDFS